MMNEFFWKTSGDSGGCCRCDLHAKQYHCGYTTSEIQQLYSQVKGVANVPVYISQNGISWWAEGGAYTDATAAPGMAEIWEFWDYPRKKEGQIRLLFHPRGGIL